jgi:hypothetical protein
MALFSTEAPGGVEDFLSGNADLDCGQETGSLTSRLMKISLALLSAFVFATASVRAADDTALLNTLGATTGQTVLLTHMAIGTLADAFAGKVYKKDQASNVINTYIGVTTKTKEQLSKLAEAGTLTRGDQQFVEHTVEVLGLVLREAGDLKDYISGGKAGDAQAYESSRKKALAEIQSLLGVSE